MLPSWRHGASSRKWVHRFSSHGGPMGPMWGRHPNPDPSTLSNSTAVILHSHINPGSRIPISMQTSTGSHIQTPKQTSKVYTAQPVQDLRIPFQNNRIPIYVNNICCSASTPILPSHIGFSETPLGGELDKDTFCRPPASLLICDLRGYPTNRDVGCPRKAELL